MNTSLEILVPDHAAAKVKNALGPMRWTRFTSVPSRGSVQRVVLGWLADLESVEGCRDLDAVWGLATKLSEPVPMILMAPHHGTGKTSLHGTVLQWFFHWSHHAEEEPYIARDVETARRIVLARQSKAEKELIASASIEDGKLVVWSCEPARFEVPVSEIAPLAKLPPDVLLRFEVSSSGSRIHWLDADVDINLDTIREYADPQLRRRHEDLARKEASRYADAIRVFREERGLKQTAIPGLTDRQVRRLEEGTTVPHLDTLKKLAAAHDLSVDDYLSELAARSRSRSASKGGRARRRSRRTT
jgi:hypothetical protein